MCIVDLIIGILLPGVIVLADTEAREVCTHVNLRDIQVRRVQREDSRYKLVSFSSKGQDTK